MNWYIVDLEIFIYGKCTEYIEAFTEEEAKLIAVTKVRKKFFCSNESIEVVNCKKKI
tara:strand:+ start:1076 stop:1246 length:171 start_codon:yes stop_codon:yes gene_type:complete